MGHGGDCGSGQHEHTCGSEKPDSTDKTKHEHDCGCSHTSEKGTSEKGTSEKGKDESSCCGH